MRSLSLLLAAKLLGRRWSGLAWPWLGRSGLDVCWQEECSQAHRAMADALIAAFEADADAITAQIGSRVLENLLASHRLWSDWLRDGRVRKFAFVAEKSRDGARC